MKKSNFSKTVRVGLVQLDDEGDGVRLPRLTPDLTTTSSREPQSAHLQEIGKLPTS